MLPKGTLNHAAKIRKSLIAGRRRVNQRRRLPYLQGRDLGGVCGVASVLLCLALGDFELKFLKGTSYHVWNAFPFPCRKKEMIVDITATQFDGDYTVNKDGVFVGVRPESFHRLDGERRFRRGLEMLWLMDEDEWYAAPRPGATLGEIRRWRSACRLLSTKF